MLGTEAIENFYKSNFLMVQEHGWNLSDIEDMIPWEREVYIAFLNKYIEEKNSKMEKN